MTYSGDKSSCSLLPTPDQQDGRFHWMPRFHVTSSTRCPVALKPVCDGGEVLEGAGWASDKSSAVISRGETGEGGMSEGRKGKGICKPCIGSSGIHQLQSVYAPLKEPTKNLHRCHSSGGRLRCRWWGRTELSCCRWGQTHSHPPS